MSWLGGSAGVSARAGFAAVVLLLGSGLAGCSSPSDDAAPSLAPTTTERIERRDVASSTTAAPPEENAAGLPDGDDTNVSRVIDGDTVVVDGGTRVRFIGVDTPETKDPRKPVQCFGQEASAQTESLIPAGTAVRLVYDVDRTDRFGRTLAYVYRAGDGLFVNAALVRDGYAQVATYPPNVAHTDTFVDLQREARQAARGLWSACGADDGAASQEPAASQPAPTTTTGPATTGDCDPAYPDVCIPSPPPDLNCADVAHRDFRVEPPDPHGFDGNRDGVGCQS